MNISAEKRLSDSPLVESIMHGYSEGAGSTIRPAEVHWHMVFVKHEGGMMPLVVGPLKSSGVVSWGGRAEILWIKFKLGTFMPHLPMRTFLDVETPLPGGAGKSFWLNGSVWQFPNFENVDTFVSQLAHDQSLAYDPLVNSTLEGQPQDISSRTVRHRFLRATGLTQTHIFQYERAQRAVAFLEQGVSILDTVYEAGYFDQPHLTRALRQWIGKTPAQITRFSAANCHSVQDPNSEMKYHETVLTTDRQ